MCGGKPELCNIKFCIPRCVGVWNIQLSPPVIYCEIFYLSLGLWGYCKKRKQIIMWLPILYHCGKHLKMHCQGSKAEKSMPFLCKQTVSTSFCKLPEAALYLSCTVLIICPWTDNCCFPCMFSLSCCHKKWVPPHYSSQQQGLALGHQPLWLPMDFSHFTIFFLLFTDQGHSGLNAEIICISHMGSYLVKVKKNQPKKEKKKQFQCCIL